MSTTIDQRVVEMRFDNQNFEKNVSTTMSTLDKLKQKLNLTGASKGLEEVNTAAKKVDMRGLGSGVEAVSAKFSAMQVIGTTALVNITNQAVNAGKRIVSALTIDPVKTGFQEYETQINAVQTILANTESKGSDINDVNKALDELNTYADKTIYNFTEMTRNIGTFTAAGVDLDTSVSAIQGIANLAAVSGSTSQQASTAMYQLSQALASGTVKLMDWNSVVNAGMGGEVFQNALKETARIHGVAIDQMIEDEGSFRETLSNGWLTSEILTETLNNFTLAAEEGTEQWNEYKKSLMDKGYSEEQANAILKMANTATDAATKVKTFTQLWDVLKESAQSGWSQTWKIIIGDFAEAKELLTPLADTLTGFINKMSDARNFVVRGVLDFASPWTALTEKLGKVQEVAKTVTNVTDKLEYFQNVVNDVWRGDYKNSDTGRFDLLEKAGYDHRVVQDLVNKGYQYKITVEDIEASHKKFGLTMETTTEETKAVTDALAGLDEETLRNAGLTEEEIRLYNDLVKGAEKYGMSVDELAKKMSETSGRDLLIESFKNLGSVFVNTFKAIGNAWGEIFDPVSIVNLYMTLEAFRDWTKTLSLVDSETGELNETGQKIQRTFKGIFAIVDLLTTILGGGLKIAFKLASSVLGYFGMSILDVTAFVGDAIVKFRDWFDSLFDVSGALDLIVPAAKKGIKAVKGWIDELKKLPGVQKAIETITKLFNSISSIKLGNIGFFDNILSAINKLTGHDYESIGEFITEGLIKGLGNGILKVVNFIGNLASTLIEKFCELLGIHSPSTVFMAIGGFIIAGLVAGISEGLISVPESLQGIVDKCVAIFKAVDWGTIVALGISVAGLLFIKKVGDALENLSAPFAGIGEILENTAELVKSFGKVTKAAAFNIRMKGIKQLAIAIAIISGSIIALVHLGGDDYGKMWNAVGMIVVLAGVLAGLSIAMNKLSDSSVDIEKGKFKLSGLKSGLMAMATAVAIIAGVTYLLGGMDEKSAKAGFERLAVIMIGILGFVKLCQVITKGDISENITKIGSLMIKLGIAMALMVGVCKLIDLLEPREMIKASAFALAFGVFVFTITSVAKSAGKNVSKVGGMMVKLAIAMGLMVGVCKIIDMLDPLEAIKAGIFALAFMGFVKALVKVTTIGKKQQIAKLGGMLLGISASMLLMVGVCKLAGKLSVEDMLKGAAFAAGFAVFVWALTSITKIGSDKQIAKVSGTILSISVAIGIMAAVCMLLSLLKLEDLAKGVIAVSTLGLVMAVMIKSLKGAQNVKGSLIAMSIAIALLSVAVAGLSFIDPAKLYSAVGAISIVLGMFALLIRSTKGVDGAIGPLIVMTAAIGVIAGMLWLLSSVTDSAQDNIKNAAALSTLMLAMSGVMFIISKMSTNLKNALKTVVGLTALAVPMVAFAWALSKMNGVDNALTNVVAISGLMLAMTGVLAIINIMNMGPANFGKALLGVIALAALTGPMAAFIAMLAWMQNIENATTNALAITKLMWNMTGLLAVLTIIGGIVIGTGGIAAGAILIGILALSAMAIPMAIFIKQIANISEIQNAESNAKLIVDLMTVMTGLLTHLAIIGPFALIGVAALAGLTLLIGAIGGIVVGLGALNELTDGGLEKLINSGIPLLIKLAEGIGTMVGKFIGCAGEAIADSLVVIGEDIVSLMESLKTASEHADGIKASSFDGVKELLEVLGDIGLTMVGMTFADIFTLGGTSMEKFEADGVAFFGALKAISSEMVGFALPENFSAESVMTLLDTLKAVSSRMLGNSWKEAFTLSKDGTMEQFKTDGVAFFGAIKEISTAMVGFSFPEDFSVEGLTKLLDALKAVSSRMLGNSWREAFTLGEGGTMEQFQADAVAFFRAIKAITPEMVGFSFPEDFSSEGFTTLLNTLKTVGKAMMGTSWTEFFTLGEGGTMEQFKTDAIAFFRAIKAIAPEMVGFSFPEDFSSKGFTTLLDTLKSVGTAMMGTSWSEFFTLGEGGTMEQLETYGTGLFSAIKAISAEATGVTTESFSTGISAIEKIKEVFASLKGIDYSGVEKFTGIGTGGFGADGPMHDIGVAIKDFSSQLAEVDGEGITTAVTNVGKIKNFISGLVGLDTSGVESFANAINSLGKISIDSFVSAFSVQLPNLTTIGQSMMSAMINGINSKKAEVPNIANSIISTWSSNITSKYGTLTNIGATMMSAMINGINSKKAEIPNIANTLISTWMSNITSKYGALTNVGSMMMTHMLNGMKSKQSSIKTLVTTILNDAINKIRSSSDAFGTAGTAIMAKFVSGISKNAASVSTAMTGSLSGALTSISGYYDSFYGAGSSLVDGFASGISANTWKAEAEAAAMAAAALDAAKKELDINSPSKVFRAIGYSVPEGFAMGIDKMSGMAEKSASSMANGAVNAVGDLLSAIATAVDSEVELQPKIRPVVDLSDVRAGAGSISSILGFGTSVGVTSNLGAISAMMNSNQNGGSDDIVSAIEKLRRDLSNLGGPRYTINGINYSNDAAIEEAFETITRAAKMGRRV